jgi:co-chaperonin GroES (HSP10)
MAINVKPLGDRVLVQPLEEKELKKGGIIIPDTAKRSLRKGQSLPSGPASSTTTARRSSSTSKSAIRSSSRNTVAPRSRSTVKTT